MNRPTQVILVVLLLQFGAGQAAGQQDPGPVPGVPELVAPLEGESLDPIEGVLDWADVTGAGGYQVQFGAACGEGLTFFAFKSQFTVTDLDNDQYYFWRVRARNKKALWGEFSECRMFSTYPDRPAVPRFTRWQEGGGEISRLTWVAPLGGTPVHHYIVQVIELGAAAPDTVTFNNVVETFQDVDVTFGMTYQARVAGVDSLARQGGFSKFTPVYGPTQSLER